MKLFVLLLVIILFLPETGFAEEFQPLCISTVFDSQISLIEGDFQKTLPQKKTIVYTKVPRGLVLSIDESEFFEKGSTVIKPEGKLLLNCISDVLKNVDNQCVVESHTDEPISHENIMKYDWELTIMRANAIVDYVVMQTKFPYDRIFPQGFGEIMPFNDNVARKDFSDRRIDFVIFDYDIER